MATAKFLSEIDDYLFSAGDKFGAESFVKFVGKLESLKSNRPESEAVRRFFENLTPTSAMEYLTDLKAQIARQKAFLTLVPDGTMAIGSTNSDGVHTYEDMNLECAFLRRVFERALEDCTESQKEKSLSGSRQSFQEFEGRGNR